MSNCNEEELREKLLNGDVEMRSKDAYPLLRKTSILLGTAIKKMRSVR
jgi:hypothetical protein